MAKPWFDMAMISPRTAHVRNFFISARAFVDDASTLSEATYLHERMVISISDQGRMPGSIFLRHGNETCSHRQSHVPFDCPFNARNSRHIFHNVQRLVGTSTLARVLLGIGCHYSQCFPRRILFAGATSEASMPHWTMKVSPSAPLFENAFH